MATKHTIMGTIEISEHDWTWDTRNLKESDLAFLEKINPSSAITFKRHLKGADSCEKHIRDNAKLLKCLRAANMA